MEVLPKVPLPSLQLAKSATQQNSLANIRFSLRTTTSIFERKMKSFITLLIFFTSITSGLTQSGNHHSDILSQELSSAQSEFYPKYQRKFNSAYRWKGKALSTIGLAVGPEHFGAVKGSVLGRIGYSKDLRFRRINRDFTLFGLYGGAEFSMFGLFAVWGSVGANAGISAGPITLDASLTFWIIGLNEKHFGTTTFNPKVGLQILDCVWLKSGYSFFPRGENIFPTWMRIGNQNVNIELSFVQTI